MKYLNRLERNAIEYVLTNELKDYRFFDDNLADVLTSNDVREAMIQMLQRNNTRDSDLIDIILPGEKYEGIQGIFPTESLERYVTICCYFYMKNFKPEDDE